MTILGMLAGVGLGLGVVLLVWGLRGQEPRPPRPATRTDRRDLLLRRLGLRGNARSKARARNLVIGLVVGLIAAIATSTAIWVVVVPIAAILLPELMSGGGGQLALARAEGLETWTRSLSGVLITGTGLEEAIRASLAATPAAIRPEMGRMVARLEAGQPIEAAVRAWADEMNDATADLIAGALIMGSRTRKGGLAAALGELADAVADQTRMLQQIEAERAAPRTTSRWVTVISLALMAFLLFNPSFSAAYRTPMGQLVLAVVIAAYLAVLWWMRSISIGKPLPRFLVNEESA